MEKGFLSIITALFIVLIAIVYYYIRSICLDLKEISGLLLKVKSLCEIIRSKIRK